MIIDFHTHVFPTPIAERAIAKLEKDSQIVTVGNGTTECLISQMDEGGIAKSVTLPVVTAPRQVESVNAFAAKNASERIVSFGGMHPQYRDYKNEFHRMREAGLLGVKFHPDYQDFFIDDDSILPMMEAAAQENLIIVFHTGVDLGKTSPFKATPKRCRAFLDKFRYNKVVFAHMGGCYLWEDVEEVIAGRDCYLDTSFTLGKCMGIEHFTRLVRAHGASKVLFASDWPWTRADKSLALLNETALNETEKNMITGENAEKLLDL